MRAALYARFSTDKQSDSSIDDQLRVCERLAATHGFTVIRRFSDAAISGGTIHRPGYQAMLHAARRREFEVIPWPKIVPDSGDCSPSRRPVWPSWPISISTS